MTYNQFIKDYTKSVDLVSQILARYRHPYAIRFQEMFNNKLNLYVNYINFKELFSVLDFKNISSVLDIGGGLGDKSLYLKNKYPHLDIICLETLFHDDADHKKNSLGQFFEELYPILDKSTNIQYVLYNGKALPYKQKSFDCIFLYAVIEHISPEHRYNLIQNVFETLNNSGYLIIARCPYKYGFIEFISRKFKLGAHEWVLTKGEILELFAGWDYEILKFKRTNNVPNAKYLQKYIRILIPLDKFLQFIKWPFSTDMLLIIQKK